MTETPSGVLTKTNTIMEAQQFFKAITAIKWDSIESRERINSNSGFSLSYHTKLQERAYANEHAYLPSVQIIAQVWYNEALVSTWGFEDDESQREFVRIWKQLRSTIEQDEFDSKMTMERNGKALFNGLMKG